jgi:cholesterol transport system auxiliary component
MSMKAFRSAPLLALLFLAACAAPKFGGDPPRLFRLNAPEPPAAAAQSAPLPGRLAVLRPQARAEAASDAILLTTSPNEVDHFANAAWTDRLPGMMQDLLVETLERRRLFSAVAPDAAGPRPDYYLAVEILGFEADYGGPVEGRRPDIRLLVKAQLLDGEDRTVIAQRQFEQKRAAPGSSLASVVAGFDEADQALLSELADWLASVAPGR